MTCADSSALCAPASPAADFTRRTDGSVQTPSAVVLRLAGVPAQFPGTLTAVSGVFTVSFVAGAAAFFQYSLSYFLPRCA